MDDLQLVKKIAYVIHKKYDSLFYEFQYASYTSLLFIFSFKHMNEKSNDYGGLQLSYLQMRAISFHPALTG